MVSTESDVPDFQRDVCQSAFWDARGQVQRGVAWPWPEAVMAANTAGYKLASSTNLEFVLYVAVMSGMIIETITKMAPNG